MDFWWPVWSLIQQGVSTRVGGWYTETRGKGDLGIVLWGGVTERVEVVCRWAAYLEFWWQVTSGLEGSLLGDGVGI